MTVMWEGCVWEASGKGWNQGISLPSSLARNRNIEIQHQIDAMLFTVWYNKEKCRGFLCGTNFMSSESSLSSLVGVVLIPLFLARGQPDKLKIESMKLIKPGDKKLHWNSRERER